MHILFIPEPDKDSILLNSLADMRNLEDVSLKVIKGEDTESQ